MRYTKEFINFTRLLTKPAKTKVYTPICNLPQKNERNKYPDEDKNFVKKRYRFNPYE
jgi:hypothetical protein